VTLRALFLLLLVPLDGGLYWSFKRLSVERDRLEEARVELRALHEASSEAREHQRRIADLTERVSNVPLEALDIALLRDRLIGVERGLALDRLSLDFRPDTNPSAGAGRGKIQASLSGSFDALYEYLRRVEALRLPLRPDEIGLRPDSGSESVLLSVSWTAVWGAPDASSPPAFSPAFSEEELARLDPWLSRGPSPLPERDLFSTRRSRNGGPEAVERPVVDAVDRPPPQSAPVPASGAAGDPVALSVPVANEPSLAGFVLARPELEKDLSRRVLAALRFEGELRLVKIGDVVGSFRVEGIEARESVVLVDRTTGERLQLFLK
jgi:hypothetical protein